MTACCPLPAVPKRWDTRIMTANPVTAVKIFINNVFNIFFNILLLDTECKDNVFLFNRINFICDNNIL